MLILFCYVLLCYYFYCRRSIINRRTNRKSVIIYTILYCVIVVRSRESRARARRYDDRERYLLLYNNNNNNNNNTQSCFFVRIFGRCVLSLALSKRLTDEFPRLSRQKRVNISIVRVRTLGLQTRDTIFYRSAVQPQCVARQVPCRFFFCPPELSGAGRLSRCKI